MSDHAIQLHHDSDAMSTQSVHPYQSVWMAHWKPTSCKLAPEVHNHSSPRYGNNEVELELELGSKQRGLEMMASTVPKSALARARTLKITNQASTSQPKVLNPKVENLTKELLFPNHEKKSLAISKSFRNDFMGQREDIGGSTSELPHHQKTDKHMGFGFFARQRIPHEVTESEKLHCGCYSPCSIHDVETMRICTTVDSMAGLRGGCPKFSQTTHSLLITKKTNFDLFRESTASKFKGNTFREFLGLSSVGFDSYPQKGVKLQSLGSSTDSEDQEKEKEKVGDAKRLNLNNESSADTDTMDLDAFREKTHLSDVTSSPANKDIIWSNTPLASQAAVVLQGIPAKSTSTSKTQSLDVDHLFPHAGSLGSEPSSRWVKRLKPSASSCYAYGTKSSKMSEPSSRGKKHMVVDQSMALVKNGGSTSMGMVKKGQEITLSHSWIKRWCRYGTQKSEPEALVICEPENSKAALDEFQKKQFPSIAAMAMMGKGLGSFRSCEFRKRGSFIVWS